MNALNNYLEYLKIRTDDYSAWKQMGNICHCMPETSRSCLKFWTLLGNLMLNISQTLLKRPNSCCGELYQEFKRVWLDSWVDISPVEMDWIRSSLNEMDDQFGKCILKAISVYY